MNDKKEPAGVQQQEATESGCSLANIRHTLRTPLNHIIGYSEMLLEEADERGLETSLDDIRKIHAAGKRLLACISELLEPAMIETAPIVQRSKPAANAGLFVESEPNSSQSPTGAETDFQSKSGRILVVDDNESNRDMLSRRLIHEGYAVCMAASGQEVLALLKNEAVDLILLDVMMPEMDGYDVLKELKADSLWRDIPVIMVSALDEVESVVRCIERGAEDYLPKPFDPVLLRARIGACLEKKRLRDQEVLYLKDVGRVTDAATAVEDGTFAAERLSDVMLRTDELGGLARVFQRMAVEVQAREQRLKQQIQELRIEIDEVKKAQQVAEITETDYFYQLKQRAKELRGRGKIS
jgi:DNA-binding response OmpR family regulator